eukprot:scaffold72155_cov13-Cyclotella_meneghiniana.AAC.1
MRQALISISIPPSALRLPHSIQKGCLVMRRVVSLMLMKTPLMSPSVQELLTTLAVHLPPE